MTDPTTIEVQPREIHEAAQRACYAIGADPEEANLAARAVLIAERTEHCGLELLQEWTSTPWQPTGHLPAPRTALLHHELQQCGDHYPTPTDVPKALLTAVAERSGTYDDTVDRGPLRMPPQRWAAFHELADTYLVNLPDEA